MSHLTTIIQCASLHLCFLFLRLLSDSTTIELCLLLRCLKSTVAELGRCIDEFEVDLLGGFAADLREQRLAEGDGALFGSHHSSLDHHPVLSHLTEVSETTHWSDWLLSQIALGRGAVGIFLEVLTNAVDL